MGRKAVVGGIVAAGIGYALGQGVSLLAAASTPPGFPYSPVTDITIKLIFAGGFGLGIYKGLRQNEKSEELFKNLGEKQKSKKEFESNLSKTASALERAFQPIPSIEKRDGGYEMGDIRGKDESEVLSKHFEKITGGNTTVRAIPGRERYVLQDMMTGRLKKWGEYVSKNPKILEEPPEIQVALFEKDVYHQKRDIASIRKSIKEKNIIN